MHNTLPLTKQTPKVSSLSKSGGDINPIRGGATKGALFQELQFTPVDFFEDDSDFFEASPFTKVAEACDNMLWAGARKETGAPTSDPLPPNRQLIAGPEEKNIFTPGGGDCVYLYTVRVHVCAYNMCPCVSK